MSFGSTTAGSTISRARAGRPTAWCHRAVKRIKAAARTFDPTNNKVELSTGDSVTYDYLVVCTGVKLDWGKVGGLSEAVGRGGVCSNYSPDHVNYTWECLKALKPGSKAVFTQPPLPFKCPGAPQKIVYLTADHLQRRGILPDVDIKYFVHAPVIFGVPFFARELVKVAERYGVVGRTLRRRYVQHVIGYLDALALFVAAGDLEDCRLGLGIDGNEIVLVVHFVGEDASALQMVGGQVDDLLRRTGALEW